jgi:hypothetical protein
VLGWYARAQELYPVISDSEGTSEKQQEAEREWFIEVEKLVEMFRETRRLFQADRVSFANS